MHFLHLSNLSLHYIYGKTPKPELPSSLYNRSPMLPEFQGCHAFPFPEQLDEMAGMMNSNLISNLLHRKRCFFQKDFRLIDTDANQILMNAFSSAAGEFSGKMIFADIQVSSNGI